MIEIAVMSKDRIDLLKVCLESLKKTNVHFSITIYDASEKLNLTEHFPNYSIVDVRNKTVGFTMNLASTQIKNAGKDYGLITADDYLYKAYWLESLLDFWRNAPEDIKLCCLDHEPLYQWNGISGIYKWENYQYAFYAKVYLDLIGLFVLKIFICYFLLLIKQEGKI